LTKRAHDGKTARTVSGFRGARYGSEGYGVGNLYYAREMIYYALRSRPQRRNDIWPIEKYERAASLPSLPVHDFVRYDVNHIAIISPKQILLSLDWRGVFGRIVNKKKN